MERERRGFEWGEDKRRSDLGGFFSCRERKMRSIGPGRSGIYFGPGFGLDFSGPNGLLYWVFWAGNISNDKRDHITLFFHNENFCGFCLLFITCSLPFGDLISSYLDFITNGQYTIAISHPSLD